MKRSCAFKLDFLLGLYRNSKGGKATFPRDKEPVPSVEPVCPGFLNSSSDSSPLFNVRGGHSGDKQRSFFKSPAKRGIALSLVSS